MPTLTLPIKPHEKQIPLVRPTARFNVIAGGRRFGKTEAEKLGDIYRVLEGKKVWWVNPTFDNTTEAWDDFLRFFRTFVPRDDINKSRREIKVALSGGSIRMIGANNFKRGSGIDHVSIDEAAFMDLENVWTEQIEPMLLDSQGTATFLSSTNGTNYFFSLYKRGLDELEPDWQSFHFTSYDSPRLSKTDLDNIKRNTTQRVFDQEYMAKFLDGGGAVFRNINNCIIDSPKREGGVVFGVDWGKDNDFTVIVAMDRTTGHILEIDRFNQIGWSLQRGRLKAMTDRWNPDVIWAEANSIGGPNIEALQQEGLPIQPFMTTSKSKAPLIEALALAFEQGEIGIPDNPLLMSELQSYTIKRTANGNFTYSAPSGFHDDMVIATALAWHGVEAGSLILFSFG